MAAVNKLGMTFDMATKKGQSRRSAERAPVVEAASVLVVEDSSDIRKILKAMIEPLGANVYEARTGREGLGVLKSQPIDVVISDLVMPEMSGMMLLHSMLESGFHVPFILISGHADKDAAIQALRLGAFDFLEKPIDEGDLRGIILEAISISLEQRKLIGDLRRQGSMLGGGVDGDSRAELYIMKLRTFRFRERELAGGEGRELPAVASDATGPRSWSELRSMFVTEAETQLAFCQASIDSLKQEQDFDREQAFVTRVVQSVRLASEAIRLSHVAELAWAIELTLATLRDRKDGISTAVPVLSDAIRKLRAIVLALDDQETQALKRRLDAISGAKVKMSKSA